MVVLWIDDDDDGEIDGSKLHKQINPTAEIKSNRFQINDTSEPKGSNANTKSFE